MLLFGKPEVHSVAICNDTYKSTNILKKPATTENSLNLLKPQLFIYNVFARLNAWIKPQKRKCCQWLRLWVKLIKKNEIIIEVDHWSTWVFNRKMLILFISSRNRNYLLLIKMHSEFRVHLFVVNSFWN